MSSDARMADVRLSLPPRQVLKAFNRRKVVTESHDHLAERPFWGPHPDRQIARVEAEFYRVGSDYLRGLYAAALGKPVPSPRAFAKSFHVDPGQIDGWGSLTDLFNSKLSAPKLLQGWDAVVQNISAGLMPQATVEAAAERMALQSSLMWRIGQRILNPPDLGWDAAERALPAARLASMQWAKTHGMLYLQGLGDNSKQALRTILVESKESGDGTSGLQRRLFDKVSQLNRDWRRIALTETAMAVTNGQLASVPDGLAHVAEWVASPLACPHCLRYARIRLEVLSAPDPSRGLTAVWAGKNNVGRSAYSWSRKEGRYRDSHEMYWPCQPLHPNCACAFVIRLAGGGE